MDPITLKKNWADGQVLDKDILNQDATTIENIINKIINSTADGDSGGDAVKMTPILALGADKDTVQKIVEALYVTIVNTVLGQIQDGSIGIEKLNFDPATQEELNAVIETINAVSPMTTQGDMIYRNATVPARLAKGLAKQMLSMNAGATAPEWIDSIYNLLTATGGLLYASAPNIPAMLALGATGKAVMSNGTTVVYGYPDPPKYQASNNVILTSNAEVYVIGATYQQLKTFSVKYSGVVRLKFDTKNNNNDNFIGISSLPIGASNEATNVLQIYQNTTANNYVSASVDVYVTAGQLYALWGRVDGGGYECYIKNLTVCADVSTGTLTNSIS